MKTFYKLLVIWRTYFLVKLLIDFFIVCDHLKVKSVVAITVKVEVIILVNVKVNAEVNVRVIVKAILRVKIDFVAKISPIIYRQIAPHPNVKYPQPQDFDDFPVCVFRPHFLPVLYNEHQPCSRKRIYRTLHDDRH